MDQSKNLLFGKDLNPTNRLDIDSRLLPLEGPFCTECPRKAHSIDQRSECTFCCMLQNCLTLFQTTNFRLFQTGKVCRRQF